MEIKTINGGIASEYDDQTIWIAKPEVGAEAARIVDDSEYTPCKVTDIIFRSDYSDEEEYSAACDALMSENSALCTGEFVTFDDIYYVAIDGVGEYEVFSSIDYDDVEFC